jgi:hypothetical protein
MESMMVRDELILPPVVPPPLPSRTSVRALAYSGIISGFMSIDYCHIDILSRKKYPQVH